uniref:F-box domain-containing protein n=1 Tax=Neobodo designis TaxID=312471 RepID=A0A7S1M7S1_NEODS
MPHRTRAFDIPKVAWAILCYLQPHEVARARAVCRRIRDLASADSLWLTIAGNLLLRRLLPRQLPQGILSYLVSNTMTGASLCGKYTYAGTTSVKEATLLITPARLGFRRNVARVSLEVCFADMEWQATEVCTGVMRYSVRDKKFIIVTRRKGIRGMVNGPRLSLIAAPHRRAWLDEKPEHFERNRNGLRLVLTVEEPCTWSTLGKDVNDLIVVTRRAPELDIDADVPAA